MDDIDSVRERYYDSAKYIRGSGKFQSMYEFFVDFQSNTKFNWLYQIYYMWHKHRVFMTWHSMVQRGQEAGVKKDLVVEVADCVYKGCKAFYYVTSSLIMSKDRLINMCLNDSMYHSVCRQVVDPLTHFYDRLDQFVDDMLWSIRDEYVFANQAPRSKRMSLKEIEAVEQLSIEEALMAHDDAMTCILDDNVDEDLKEHFKKNKGGKRNSLPSIPIPKSRVKVDALNSAHAKRETLSTSTSPRASAKEKLTSLFYRMSPRRKE